MAVEKNQNPGGRFGQQGKNYDYRNGVYTKEIVERRHGEPIKFLFLPTKMGLLGSQASTEKKIGCEL